MENFDYNLRDIYQLFQADSTETGDIAEKDTPVREKTGFSVQTRMIFISRRNRIMTTTATRTRVKVSAKSWIKAERKAAAKGYNSPNRWFHSFNALYWAAHHRRRMEEHKQEMFESCRPGLIKVYFEGYIYQRIQYKKSVYRAKSWNKPLPLP